MREHLKLTIHPYMRAVQCREPIHGKEIRYALGELSPNYPVPAIIYWTVFEMDGDECIATLKWNESEGRYFE